MREIASFQEPVRHRTLSLCLLDVKEIEVPHFQRDLSETLKERLKTAIEKLGFLVPIIVVQREGKFYVIE